MHDHANCTPGSAGRAHSQQVVTGSLHFEKSVQNEHAYGVHEGETLKRQIKKDAISPQRVPYDLSACHMVSARALPYHLSACHIISARAISSQRVPYGLSACPTM